MEHDKMMKWTPILRAALAVCSLGLCMALPANAVTAATPGRFLPVPLNEPSQDGYHIVDVFLVTPDEKTVVYIEDGELFSVPASGGTRRHLASNVSSPLQITSDGRMVVFSRTVIDEPADPNEAWTSYWELVSMPVTGGELTVLDMFDSTSVDEWWWLRGISPDDKWIAYASGGKIFVVPLSGGKPQLVATLESASEEIPHATIQFSPDSETLLYLQSPDEKLFSVPRTGGTPVQLVGPKDLPAINDYQFTPDGGRIVARFSGYSWANNGLFELYSFPTDGGEGVRLSASHERWLEEPSAHPVFLPGGADFVYASWDDDQKRHTIVKVSVDGGERSVLVTADGPAQILHVEEVAGDDALLYSVLDAQGRALYSTPIANGAPLQLTPIFSDIYELLVDEEGNLAVLLAVDWYGASPTYFLHAVPIAGGDMRLLTSSTDYIFGTTLSSDGTRVFFESYEEFSTNLYRVPSGGGDPEYMGIDDAWEFRVVEAGERVIIQTSNGLFSVVEASEAQYLPIMENVRP